MSIATKRRIIATALIIAAAGANKHVVNVPKGWVKRIQIAIGTTPTFGAGSYVANCALKSITIRYNTIEIIHLDGIMNVDDLQSAGMQLIREIEGQNARVALTDNYWVITFPDAIPVTPQVPLEVEFLFATDERMGGDAAQATTAGDVDIEIEYAEGGRKKPRIINWTSGNWNHSNATGDFYDYLPASPPGKKLRLLAFVTHDQQTRANTTFASLQIQLVGKIKFDGTMAKLKNEWQQKSGLNLNTGCFFWSPGKGGIKVDPFTLLLKFNASAAGTTKYIEWCALSY